MTLHPQSVASNQLQRQIVPIADRTEDCLRRLGSHPQGDPEVQGSQQRVSRLEKGDPGRDLRVRLSSARVDHRLRGLICHRWSGAGSAGDPRHGYRWCGLRLGFQSRHDESGLGGRLGFGRERHDRLGRRLGHRRHRLRLRLGHGRRHRLGLGHRRHRLGLGFGRERHDRRHRLRLRFGHRRHRLRLGLGHRRHRLGLGHRRHRLGLGRLGRDLRLRVGHDGRRRHRLGGRRNCLRRLRHGNLLEPGDPFPLALRELRPARHTREDGIEAGQCPQPGLFHVASRLGLVYAERGGLGGDDEAERLSAVGGQVRARGIAGSLEVAGSPARLGQVQRAGGVELVASGQRLQLCASGCERTSPQVDPSKSQQ